MTKKTIYKDDIWLENKALIEKFRHWLFERYGEKRGSIRKFADEFGMEVRKVYPQLNGYAPPSDELKGVMEKCLQEEP